MHEAFDVDFWTLILGLATAYLVFIWVMCECVGLFCEADPEYESGICEGSIARRNKDTGEVQKRVRKGRAYRWVSLPVCAWGEFLHGSDGDMYEHN